MKIRKLAIQNYKIFDDVSFDFTDENGETLSTVVLAGMNGCGKTTVLEVIKDFLSSKCNFNVEQQIMMEIELSENEQRNIAFVQPILSRDTKVWEKILNKIETSPVVQLSSVNEVLLFSRSLTPLTDARFIYSPAKKAYVYRERILNINHTEVFSLDNQKDRMKEIALKNLRDAIIKNRDIAPRATIERHISDITKSLSDLPLNTHLVDLESEQLIFESANGKRIYFEQLSHGEQELYFQAIYLNNLDLKNIVILIDEPEAAFHPTWQQKIATLYSNVGENNQVFMATHSPHIMASVPPESLFVLNVDEETKKITAVNMGKAGKHSQGLEPNRILKEVMQVDTLREYQTQVDIERLTALLTLETFEGKEAQSLIEKLTDQLGQQDPFIIRLEHQLLMLNRKKQKPVAAE